MRAAAVDLGRVRVGLAVADDLGYMAHPRAFLDGRQPRRVLVELSKLAKSEGITHFLVGLPRSLKGRETAGTKRARAFADQLRERSGCTVELVDEWLTTVEATARLRDGGLDARQSRSRVDSASAAVLLQSWLDARRSSADGETST